HQAVDYEGDSNVLLQREYAPGGAAALLSASPLGHASVASSTCHSSKTPLLPPLARRNGRGVGGEGLLSSPAAAGEGRGESHSTSQSIAQLLDAKTGCWSYWLQPPVL